MVMAHSLCYSSLTPSGGQLFQSPALDVYGRNASRATAHIQNPLCWQADCFVPEYYDPTAPLDGRGLRQVDGTNENMDTGVVSPGYNPLANGMRTTSASCELKYSAVRNEFCSRRKHKREQEEDDSPAQKKRVTEKMLDCLVTSVNISCSSWPDNAYPQGNGVSDVASTSWQVESTSQEFRVAEKKEACVEMKPDPSREGLEKLREIENRLVPGDPEADGIEISDMPVLVLSDSLQEELRNGLEQILPRKIMESLNRPCMELVLWRPPCEPLSDKLAALTAQRQSKHRQPQCDPDVYNKSAKPDPSLMCGDMNLTSTSEEDMEL
uniref:coiled-coil domain-containing protein 117 n=1 Tax=Pristiophorus japonicus TaxID=55135 RepID=UPI00398F6D86